MGKLSDVAIRQLKPDPKRILLIGDGNRLYLRLYPSGRKTWVLRSSKGGRQTLKTLIPAYPKLSLLEARRIAQGGPGDPKDVQQTQFSKETIGGLAQRFYETQIEKRYRRPKQVLRYLTRDLAPIAKDKIVDVTRADLADLLEAKARNGPVAANRLLTIMKRMFRYGLKRGLLERDPTALLDRDVAGGDEVKRERVLNDNEIRKLWEATAGDGAGTPKGPAHHHGNLLRFLLVTGQRINETQLAQWEHVDFRKRVWSIPRENTKGAKRDHWVALPQLAIDLLKPMKAETGSVFPKRTATGVQAWLRRWCERERITPPFTPHDLRRTVNTRMNELGIAPHIVERVMNHSMQGLMAVYNQATYEAERTEAQEKWAQSLSALIANTQRSKKRK